MGEWLCIAVWGFVSVLRRRRDLALENVALRQQLVVLRRQPGSVRLRDRDRLFWVWLRCVWLGWRGALVLVQPATVVEWHRKGFRAYWRWKSRARGGRPRIDPSVRSLIRHMWSSNPTWGAPRIQAELHKLGIDVSDAAVRRYRPPRVSPPSLTWRPFLENHRTDIAAMDFFIVPTATFRVLYVLLIMSHDRRRILHFNVTTSPSAQWTAQQVVEAFPYETQPRFLLHDRDSIFGSSFARRVGSMGIEEVVTAPPTGSSQLRILLPCVANAPLVGRRRLPRAAACCTSGNGRSGRPSAGRRPPSPVRPPARGLTSWVTQGSLHGSVRSAG